MAKPSWLSIDPSTGSGNGTIVNTGSVHTGRVARQGVVTVTATGVAEPVTYKVTQEAKPEFVLFDNGAEMAAEKTAGKVLVKGKSNSSKLTFALVGDGAGVELPVNYSVAGVETDNAAEIDGDPGAANEFAFSLELDIPLNDTVEEVVRTIKVTSNGGETAQIAVKQAAGDPRIAVNPTEITLAADGTAVSVEVESNTSWTVA